MANSYVGNINTSLFLVSIVLVLSACVSTPEKQAGSTPEVKAESATTAVAKAETKTETVTSKDTTAEGTAEKTTESAGQPEVTPLVREAVGETTKLEKVEEKPVEPPRIVDSCQNEPFVKLEKQALASLEKGLAATKAGKFGVGFRNENDYKRWKGIHEKLFKTVNESCNALKQCAKKNPKDKDAKCAVQAYVFNEWQQKAKSFTNKAKAVETTEPDPICSPEPDLADEPKCFHALAENFDNFCSAPECKEVSDCWRGVGFLDQAIKQATQACRFAHQELKTCRGYLETTKRRKDKFNRCKDMQEKLKMPYFPAI